MNDRCGSTDTRSGEPCQRGPNCPHHRGPGQPTKYRPRYCDKVVELAREGAGVAEIADEIGVSKQTLHNWREAFPRFLDAMTRARDAAEAWWARQGKKGIWAGSDFNASAYRLQMMNRFGWGEKSSHEVSGEMQHDHEINYDRATQALAVLAGEASATTDAAPENGGRPVELGQGDTRRFDPS